MTEDGAEEAIADEATTFVALALTGTAELTFAGSCTKLEAGDAGANAEFPPN